MEIVPVFVAVVKVGLKFGVQEDRLHNIMKLICWSW